ncbi:type II toxin-antitoxin system RatA family toxin [Volucribacter amazonae]|uniref:Ubiquinone-binding protein n=1 Tax=Volucribacter amazonae TaxID=256731 RepID=A0A9X4PD93_9PAST|nr:type II toxin-antitoxin system RatA family toxin [Volucribacter amazonae]MDG6896167.1 ubiquinone-binding protein [Volucribacter amazonae]
MPQITTSALVPYSCQQMYQLVNDYARYPEFVPGCIATRSILQQENELIGELTISKAGIQHSFSTRNLLTPYRTIQMQLVEGPFKHLQGEWCFDEIDEQSCQIRLNLNFEFANPLISFAFGKIFTELTQRMVNAFKQRAKEVYDV